MIALKQRLPSFSGFLRLRCASFCTATLTTAIAVTSLPFLSNAQDESSADENLALDDFAEIYVDRYFEPSEDLRLSEDNRIKAAALAQYSIGRMLENEGQPDAAIEAYEKVLELQPGEIMLGRKTANLLARTGQTDKARKVLERVFKLNPDKARAHIVLSEFIYTYFADNETDRDYSLKLAKDAVKKFPDAPETYENLVRRYLVEGQRTEARKVMDLATARDNKDPKFWLRLGQLAQRTWPTRTSGTQEPVLVNGIYEKALERGKNDLAIVEAVGDYYLKSNQQKRAQEIYESIIEKSPERLDIRRKLVAVFIAQSDVESAITALKGIVEIDPQDAATHRELGRIYHTRMIQNLRSSGLRQPEEGDTDMLQAAQYYRKALRAGKGTAAEYIETGRLFRWAGKTNQSVDVLDEGAYLFPDSPSFPWELAETYTSGELWKEAVAPMERTVKLATQAQPEMLNELFYFRYGVVYERIGDIEKASEKFRKSIELIGKRDPDNPASDSFVALVYNYLGYTWVENDMNIDEGGELIKSALALDPESSAITDSLGWYYFKKEKFEDARKTLLKAKAMMKVEAAAIVAEGGTPPEEDGVIYDHIAQAHWMTGYKDEAIKYMELAVAAEEERKEEFQKRLKEYREGTPPQVARPEDKSEQAKPDPKPEPAVETDTPKEAE